MAKPSVIGISGNLATPSRTHTLVATTANRIASEVDATCRVIDLSDLPELGNLRSRAAAHPLVEAAFKLVEGADLLIVGSPVYKGSYTGLFKHFVDFIDYRALVGTPVALLATGGSERHALVIEHQLRPLFSFFQAQPLATGVFLTDREIVDGAISTPANEQRFERLVLEAVHAVHTRAATAAAHEAA